MSMMNRPSDLLEQIVVRITEMGAPASDFHVLGLLDEVIRCGVAVRDINEQEFLYLLQRYTREDMTELACPHWCTRDAGHPFESESFDGIQSRPHEQKLPQPAFPGHEPFELYLSLVQEDERARGDDSTARRAPAKVSFAVDSEFCADELRKIAAALLDAADRLDEVTGRTGWTEDQL